MAALAPAIYVLLRDAARKDVDAGHKAGHDENSGLYDCLSSPPRNPIAST